MREIKFRAFEKTLKIVLDVLVIDWRNELVDLEGGLIEQEFKDVELLQYTGLKDKNGVEIYESDVLTSNVQPCKMVNPIKDGYGVVRFENGMFKLGAISLVTFISKMEVIGNIYENPELLDIEELEAE